jgi:hypothetical protein
MVVLVEMVVGTAYCVVVLVHTQEWRWLARNKIEALCRWREGRLRWGLLGPGG